MCNNTITRDTSMLFFGASLGLKVTKGELKEMHKVVKEINKSKCEDFMKVNSFVEDVDGVASTTFKELENIFDWVNDLEKENPGEHKYGRTWATLHLFREWFYTAFKVEEPSALFSVTLIVSP